MKKYLIALAMAAYTLCGNAVSAQPSAVAQHVKVSVTQAGDTTGIEAYSDTTEAYKICPELMIVWEAAASHLQREHGFRQLRQRFARHD